MEQDDDEEYEGEETESEESRKKAAYVCNVCSAMFKEKGMCPNCEVILKKKGE